jgi:aspartate racemase
VDCHPHAAKARFTRVTGHVTCLPQVDYGNSVKTLLAHFEKSVPDLKETDRYTDPIFFITSNGMKTIGVIGGMSWESSAEYYRLLNQYAKVRLGGHHNARILMVTVDFDVIEALQRSGDWKSLGRHMADAAQQLERGGANIVILATNTMHRVHASIETAIAIPFLHIADPTGEALRSAGIERVGLLGTRYTMEQDFYIGRLHNKHGLDVVVPDDHRRADVHRIIYDELCHGVINAESRQIYQDIIKELAERGAQAVILGCTEITLLIRPEDSALPVFDTTALHARAAIDWAVQSG